MIKNPYRGLMPFTEEDEPFFFGRDSESEIVCANLIANRLTIVYGPTGVGKSSVLRAGVLHRLHQQARENVEESNCAELLPVYFSEWSKYPKGASEALIEAMTQSAAKLNLRTEPARAFASDAQKPRYEDPPQSALERSIRAWSHVVDGPILLILDQAEEYFLYNRTESSFERELAAVLSQRDNRVSCIISIREDCISMLDRFKGKISGLFDNTLRIDYLSHKGGVDAIFKPIEAVNKSLPAGSAEFYSVEPKLAFAVLNAVSAGQLIWDEELRGASTTLQEVPGTSRIETPYLQIVMSRIWKEELANGSHSLRLSTLQSLKGAKTIIQQHLSTAVSGLTKEHRKIASECLRYLVTQSGTKIALSAEDLTDYTRLSVEAIQTVLDSLAHPSVRILRSVNSGFEIYHDVLGPGVLDWRRKFLKEQSAERFRGWMWVGSSVVGVILTGAAAGLLFLNKKTKTLQNKGDNVVNELNKGFGCIADDNFPCALAHFEAAQAVKVESVSPLLWNDLCWKGAVFESPQFPVGRYAKVIMPACENAVGGEPTNPHYHDSRGVARALANNFEGAIDDFNVYINADGIPAERKAERQQWVSDLKISKNPFTPAYVKRISTESFSADEAGKAH